ncbi:hypothetical protein BH10CYA1_BH10CYA1_44430 [soil metagenome]
MTNQENRRATETVNPEVVLKVSNDLNSGASGAVGEISTTDAKGVLTDGIYSEDPSNMVRQARKMRPSSALVSIAEIFDVGVIGFFGAVVVALSVAGISCLLPGINKDFSTIVGCSVASGLVGFMIFMMSALIPVFFPVALLALQAASGTFAGAIIFEAICSWIGADPTSVPVISSFASNWLTLVFSILPIFACPLYFSLSLSSKWQTSLGWSTVGLMVCDENGMRASFAKTWKRTLLRLWWPVMFPGKLSYSGLIDDWVEENSKTVLMLKPQNLKAELIKAKDQVQKSSDKVTIIARNAVIGAGARQLLGQRVQGVALSSQTVKKMLKPDWPAIILRAESYFVIMLSMLFIARASAAYWSHVYFKGFSMATSFSSLAWLDEHPYVTQSVPVAIALLYIVLLIVARRATPQVLEMTSKGFTLKSKSLKGKRKLLNWEDVTDIHLEQGTGKDTEEKWMVFVMGNAAPVKVRLDIIRSISSKEELLRALERWAPHAAKDSELLSSLQPPSDYSYTDIWLEALTGPPKRDKLKPLIDGAVLKDNQYRVTKVIAVGGQGSVYLANDCISGEDVVLKEFVLPVYVDLAVRRKAIERFEKESRLLKQLEHPRIVKLLDYFVEDYRAYMVLEHLNGKNLHQIVKESGQINDKEVISLALQMCEILKYLHEQEPPVVHRDFTPENLILGTDGTLRLIDFNVAQTLDQAATTTGTVVGKPSYLAPEQFRGEPMPSSDIYSMGATLAYILTGEDPTPIAQSHPAQIVPSISAGLDLIVATCTNYDSALRYQSIEDIENALRSC